jgi:hypothetical protein
VPGGGLVGDGSQLGDGRLGRHVQWRLGRARLGRLPVGNAVPIRIGGRQALTVIGVGAGAGRSVLRDGPAPGRAAAFALGAVALALLRRAFAPVRWWVAR